MVRWQVCKLQNSGFFLSTLCIPILLKKKGCAQSSYQILAQLPRHRRISLETICGKKHMAEYIGVVLSEVCKVSNAVLHISAYCPYRNRTEDAFLIM